MKAWEYHIEYCSRLKNVDTLNYLGLQGWELVTIHDVDVITKAYTFKREIIITKRTSASR